MTDDVLSRAARALREETAGDDASARFTRSRIMASVHEDRVKRRTRWAFLAPIAATFIAASAYGSATGKTHEAMLVLVRALGIHRSEAPATVLPRRSSATPAAKAALAPTPPATPAAASPPEPEAPPAVLLPPAAPTSTPPVGLRRAEPAGPAPTTTAAAPSHSLPGVGGAAAADPTFELYRAAHQAHFADRDYGRALTAWGAYLKAAPNGALVPEARYNRALCLVRLHRNDEARAALKPFATGQYGTYRREDAERLLSALPAEQSGPEL